MDDILPVKTNNVSVLILDGCQFSYLSASLVKEEKQKGIKLWRTHQGRNLHVKWFIGFDHLFYHHANKSV